MYSAEVKEWSLDIDKFLPLDIGLSQLISLISLQFLAILALPLMMFRTNSGIKLPKWFSYAAYPGHLLILWLIKMALKG